MSNRLQAASSAYLLQHADNPVDWWQWGQDAIDEAKNLNRPLLVSVGYSSCHWCHVMAHESFEDPAVAQVMNDHFVCVKVDREEHPELDGMLIEAVQAISGQAGWPLNVFITPELLPIHGGTYYPPSARGGQPSWTTVVNAVADAWHERSDEIRSQVEPAREFLAASTQIQPDPDDLNPLLLSNGLEKLFSQVDIVHGGFGGAPKFPPHSSLLWLYETARSVRLLKFEDRDESTRLADRSLQTANQTLLAIAGGGIHDQLSGGFHRYAVDANWTVPHFEKMLYDNALLARVYTQAVQANSDSDPELAEQFQDVAQRTLNFLLSDFKADDGLGFIASFDADSEGEEGAYYRWTPEQLRQVLSDDDSAAAAKWFGVYFDPSEHTNPHQAPAGEVLEDRGPKPNDDQRQRIVSELLAARAQRPTPGKDQKRVLAWNALAVTALAEAAQTFANEKFREAAIQTLRFLSDHLVTESATGQPTVWRSFNDGRAQHLGSLEDVGCLLEAAIAVFELSGEGFALQLAIDLAELLKADFVDHRNGGFFSSALSTNQLPVSRKVLDDLPAPSGGSAAASALVKLASIIDDPTLTELAGGWFKLVAKVAPASPQSLAYGLLGIHKTFLPQAQLVVTGGTYDEQQAILKLASQSSLSATITRVPVSVGLVNEFKQLAILTDKNSSSDQATAYLCVGNSCDLPTSDSAKLEQQLAALCSRAYAD